MEPGQIIKQARKKKGWSQQELGRRVGISQVAVKKIESEGPDATQQSKYLPQIAAALGVDLGKLVPAGALSGRLDQTTNPAPSGAADFPIYASAEGGSGEVIVDSDPIDYMLRPPPMLHVRDGYGVVVTGTSMEPEYRPGDTALVHPRLPIAPDEVYIFYGEREGVSRAMIKHLRKITDDNWFVSQHNPPEGGSKELTLPRKEWRWAHRVIGKYRR